MAAKPYSAAACAPYGSRLLAQASLDLREYLMGKHSFAAIKLLQPFCNKRLNRSEFLVLAPEGVDRLGDGLLQRRVAPGGDLRTQPSVVLPCQSYLHTVCALRL